MKNLSYLLNIVLILGIAGYSYHAYSTKTALFVTPPGSCVVIDTTPATPPFSKLDNYLLHMQNYNHHIYISYHNVDQVVIAGPKGNSSTCPREDMRFDDYTGIIQVISGGAIFKSSNPSADPVYSVAADGVTIDTCDPSQVKLTTTKGYLNYTNINGKEMSVPLTRIVYINQDTIGKLIAIGIVTQNAGVAIDKDSLTTKK